jgi:rhomboid protease GluP
MPEEAILSDPERQDNHDLQPLLRRLDDEFGPRREQGEPQDPEQPAPVYGEAPPVEPPRTYRLKLPLGPVRAVWVLLALNIAIFVIPSLLQLIGVRVGGIPIYDYTLFLGAKDNASIAQGGQYYRFLTAMFLHGSLLHIGFNAWALYAIGPEAERIYGTVRFLALYFLAGLAGGVASYAFSSAPSVGASGAIFGMIGGLAAFYYVSRRLLGEMSRQQLGSLITVVMINLFIGFSTPLIDNSAHLGGLAGGALAGWLLAPRLEVDERLYPPQVVRRSLPFAWPGALASLALLVFLVMTISPPIG